MTSARERLAARLRRQGDACSKEGSRLYGELLEEMARDAVAGGPTWRILQERIADPADSALALRLMGAVHRLVLQGEAPELARSYPSAGGDHRLPGAWRTCRELLEQCSQHLAVDVARPVQTNEVGRCGSLVGGFLLVARACSLPLHILEIGASAGLNLLWDRYLYEARGTCWGDETSPVRLCDFSARLIPPFEVQASVQARRGCDIHPLDPRLDEDRLTLMSFVWPDQLARLRNLKAALSVAQRTPAAVDPADAVTWLGAQLASPRRDVATVVFHSIVLQYLDDSERTMLKDTMHEAGSRADATAPLAWLRMEPSGPEAEVRLMLWPGGEDRLIARSGFHGRHVMWLGG